MHVMICDDDPDIQFLLNHILTANNYQVTRTMNREEAISNARIHFDLIIMDYFLEKDNGLDVLESFREISGYNCPVILLTGREFGDSSALCNKHQLLDVIQKPFNPAWLSEYFQNLRLS